MATEPFHCSAYTKNDVCESDGRGEVYKNIEKELEAFVAGKNARIGIAVIINGRDTVAVNGNRDFPMMSVFKFPLALAVAQNAELSGRLLSESISFEEDALKEGTYSPMLEKYGKGLRQMSLFELLQWSMVESDNNAADILLNYLGGPSATMTILKQLGVSDEIKIEVSEDDMHRDQYLSYLNRATPLAMAELFDNYDRQLRHKGHSFEILSEMLENCQTGHDRLAAPVKNAGAIIGHKTGTGFTSNDGRISALNDCGYVHLNDDCSYSIAVFIADSGYDIAETAQIISGISEITLTALNK